MHAIFLEFLCWMNERCTRVKEFPFSPLDCPLTISVKSNYKNQNREKYRI